MWECKPWVDVSSASICVCIATKEDAAANAKTPFPHSRLSFHQGNIGCGGQLGFKIIQKMGKADIRFSLILTLAAINW